jgi:hypothetical protein
MKFKHAITFLVLGYCFDFIGALQKIMHSPSANTFLITATVLKVFGGLLFLYKILNHPKAKEFINY